MAKIAPLVRNMAAAAIRARLTFARRLRPPARRSARPAPCPGRYWADDRACPACPAIDRRSARAVSAGLDDQRGRHARRGRLPARRRRGPVRHPRHRRFGGGTAAAGPRLPGRVPQPLAAGRRGVRVEVVPVHRGPAGDGGRGPAHRRGRRRRDLQRAEGGCRSGQAGAARQRQDRRGARARRGARRRADRGRQLRRHRPAGAHRARRYAGNRVWSG